MDYHVFVKLNGQTQWDWQYQSLEVATKRVTELLGGGYEDAWIEPTSVAEALDDLEAEVASLRGRLKNRNRQIRDLRRSLRK